MKLPDRAARQGSSRHLCTAAIRTGKARVHVEAYRKPVNIGDARVQPGDLLVRDADGVVALPAEHEDTILATAEASSVAEDAIRNLLARGARFDEAREQWRTRALQMGERT